MDERIVLFISGIFVISIFPALILRVLANNWLMVLLDLGLFAASLLIFVCTFVNQYTLAMRHLLATLIAIGVVSSCILNGISQIYWLYPSVIALFYIVKPVTALITSFVVTCLIMAVLLPDNSAFQLISIAITVFATMIFVYVFSIETDLKHNDLQTLATEDFLTGIGNRRAFQRECEQVLANAKRHRAPASLIALDLDNFKQLNDTHGHGVGDEVLKFVSKTLALRLRRTDTLYRLGGEEFAILVKDGYLHDAQKLCNDLREHLIEEDWGTLPAVTISFGIAQLGKDESILQWTQRADEAMYQSKHSGKDTISLAS